MTDSTSEATRGVDDNQPEGQMPSTRIHKSPLLFHPPFVAAGGALLIAAFVTDLMYYQTSDMQWANFSVWLITGGLMLALIAAIFLLIDVLRGRTGPLHRAEFIGLVLVAVLSIFNAFIHSRDAWTSVVPQGIIISAVVAIVLLAMSFRGWSVTAARAPVQENRS
jgi:uncharacterized membrane protein